MTVNLKSITVIICIQVEETYRGVRNELEQRRQALQERYELAGQRRQERLLEIKRRQREAEYREQVRGLSVHCTCSPAPTHKVDSKTANFKSPLPPGRPRAQTCPRDGAAGQARGGPAA